MRGAPSSSSLRLWEETTCPKALDYAATGARRDTSVFDVGIAAHAVIEAIQKHQAQTGDVSPETWAQLAAQTVAALATVGRSFRGHREPPMPMTAAHNGAAIALSYLSRKGSALPDGALPEQDLAIDFAGDPCAPSSSAAAWRAILDRVSLSEDEEGEVDLTVTDYKTAWPAGPVEVESLQLKGQAVLALANLAKLFGDDAPTPTRLIREVVNLRTGVSYYAVNSVDDPEIEQWRREMIAIGESFPRIGRAPNPGIGCARCPYAEICDDRAQTLDLPTLERLALLSAEHALLTKLAQASDLTSPAKNLPGYYETTAAEVLPEAAALILARWSPKHADDDALLGLLTRLVNVSSVRALAKELQIPEDQLLRHAPVTRWRS